MFSTQYNGDNSGVCAGLLTHRPGLALLRRRRRRRPSCAGWAPVRPPRGWRWRRDCQTTGGRLPDCQTTVGRPPDCRTTAGRRRRRPSAGPARRTGCCRPSGAGWSRASGSRHRRLRHRWTGLRRPTGCCTPYWAAEQRWQTVHLCCPTTEAPWVFLV